jgi:hypothetical protein
MAGFLRQDNNAQHIILFINHIFVYFALLSGAWIINSGGSNGRLGAYFTALRATPSSNLMKFRFGLN